ncbi:unnamed protein product [Symbiodinium microadriaticum]|nr:unnamed protein product [Symbiodinium microadriaticum]
MAGSFTGTPRSFLLLGEGFKEPRWRQCLVLKKARSGWIMMARADQAELAGLKGKVNTYEVGDRHYVLVEGMQKQVRSEEPPDGYLALEQNREMLLERGRSLLTAADQDAMFATASEELEETHPAGARSSGRVLVEDDEESSSSNPDVDDPETDAFLAKLLERSKQNKPVSGGSVDKTASVRKESGDSSSSDVPAKASFEVRDLMQLVGKKGGNVDPLQAIALQHILASDKDSSKKRHSRKKKSHRRASSSSSSASSGGQDKGLRGSARALARYRKNSTRMWRKPMRHVKRYIAEVEEELGVDETPYNLWDYTKRIPFGRQKGLYRMHHLASHILKKLLNDDPEGAALMTVLTLRCLHQTALDGGNWELGWLTTLKDPLARKKWGGEAQDLEAAADYLRAVQDLEKRSKQLSWKPKDEEEEEAEGADKSDKVWRPPKGRGRGRGTGGAGAPTS